MRLSSPGISAGGPTHLPRKSGLVLRVLMSGKRKRGQRQSRVGTGWTKPSASATSKLCETGFVLPRAYQRAVCQLRQALLPCAPRSRDTRGNSSRTTEPFQTRALRNMRPDVLEPTRKIVSGKLDHFRAAMSIESHPLADVVVDSFLGKH